VSPCASSDPWSVGAAPTVTRSARRQKGGRSLACVNRSPGPWNGCAKAAGLGGPPPHGPWSRSIESVRSLVRWNITAEAVGGQWRATRCPADDGAIMRASALTTPLKDLWPAAHPGEAAGDATVVWHRTGRIGSRTERESESDRIPPRHRRFSTGTMPRCTTRRFSALDTAARWQSQACGAGATRPPTPR
jgi:hypothetical protein